MAKRVFFWMLAAVSFSFALGVSDSVVETDESVTVTTKDSLFDTETLYTHQKLVTCQPAIQAVYKIVSGKKLAILPQKQWQSGTRYRCQLAPHLATKSTQTDTAFTFATKPFGLQDHHYFAKEKLLRLEFNDAIDPKTITQSIALYTTRNLAKTKLRYSVANHGERVVLLAINEPVDAKLQLQINERLRSLTGAPLAKAIQVTIGAVTHAPVTLNAKKKPMEIDDKPRIVTYENGDFALRLFFDDTFDEKPIKRFIQINGIEDFRIKKDIYLNSTKRREYNISGSYYYVDLISDEIQPNTTYTLTLKKGLAHYRELKKDTTYTLKTGDKQRTVFFESDKPYLSSHGEIGFSSINIDKATLILERITQDNYRYFINYSDGNSEHTNKFTRQIFAKNVTLDNPKNKKRKQKILLKDIMPQVPYGVYKVTVTFEDKGHKGKTIDRSVSKVLFVSDIGMAVNLSKEQAFVSLLSLSSAAPLEAAKVELYSTNNILIAEATSDRNGIAVIDKKALLNKEPKAIIVTTKTDKNFLLLGDTVNDVTRDALETAQERYKASVYFQSNIIRPGGTIHALITLKDRDFISGSKLPVKLILSRPYEDALHAKVYTTDAYGVIDFSYTMPHHEKTGAYRLKVKLGDKVIGSKTIDVEAFMPPKIANTVTTDKPYCSSGEYLNTTVTSRYLFGAAGSNLTGKVNYSATALDYTHPNYPKYSFTNQELNHDNDLLYIDLEHDITLDANGKSSIMLPCSTDQKVPSILKALIGATIMDDTQPVSAYKELRIYPYKHLVGVKLDSDTIASGKALSGKAVLIDPQNGKPIDRNLTAVVTKIVWHYNYSSGNYNWEKESKVVDSFPVQPNHPFHHTVPDNGRYILTIHDRLGGHSASSEFDVSGWGYSNLSPKDDLKKVEIKIADKLYKKGDTITASFTSPILEGKLLVTLEGKKIHWHTLVDLEKGTAEVQVPITVDPGRGLYLHATVIRKSDTPSTLVPYRAMGYRFIAPDRTQHQTKITLNHPPVTPSKTTVPLTITTDRESALLVSVVDSGILGIVEQKPPKLFDFFNPQPDKELLYYDLYDRVMHYLTQGSIIAFGAGDGDDEELEKRKKHLPPPDADRVKPFMLWSGIVHTSNKQAKVDLKIPEFNGKGTIVVIALDNRSVGVADSELLVKDDILIKPSYPRFVLKGDRIDVPVRLFNNTDKPQTLKLRKTVSPQLSFALESMPITVPPNSSKVITAKLEALSEGKASIRLNTQAGGKNYEASVSLAVMSPYTIQTRSFQDSISTKKTIITPKEYRGGKLLFSLSKSLLGRLYGDLKYLISYPYGCAEQTSSKLAAMYYAKPFFVNDKLFGDIDNFIRQGIKKLSRMQNSKGEFSYWRAGGYVHEYASLYASDILLALDAGGHTVDAKVKERILKALKKIARKKSGYLEGRYSNAQRIYAAYILSTYGELDNSTANMLYDKKIYEKYYLSWYYMSAIMKNIGNERLAKTLHRGAKTMNMRSILSINYTPSFGDFATQGRDTFLLFYLNSKYFGVEKWEFDLAKKQLTGLYSTHDRAMAFRALASYLGKAVHEKMNVRVTLDGTQKTYQKSVAFTQTMGGDTIVIEPLSGIANYVAEFYKHLPRPVKNRLSDQKELSITREFIDTDGEPVNLNNIVQGSKLYAKITLANHSRIENVVLNHRIPACMEIVNAKISKGAGNTFKNVNLDLDYRDIRDDRVLYFLDLHQKKVKKKGLGGKTKSVVVQNKTIVYIPLMATSAGDCHLPAVTAEAMYDARINDYAKEAKFVRVRTREEAKKYSAAHPAKHARKQQAIDLVREYYLLEASSNRAGDFVKYFSYPITHHFTTRNATRDDLVENKKRYFAKWPSRYYTIQDVRMISIDKTTQSYRVLITFGYRLENKRRSIKGESRHLVTLSGRKGRLTITGIDALK